METVTIKPYGQAPVGGYTLSAGVQATFQRIVFAIAYIGAGIAVAGSILDAVSNSLQLVTPRIAVVVTVAMVVMLGAVEIAVRTSLIRWNFPGTSTSHLTRLGLRWHLGTLGVIATLWLPTLVSRRHAPPMAADPLRYRYVTLDSGATRFFVARRVKEGWRPEISRRAFIVPNETFLTLQKLLPPPPEAASLENEPSLAASQRPESWIETTWPRMQSALSSEAGWNAFASHWFDLEEHDGQLHLFLWRYARAGDLASFRSEDPEWIDFDMKLRAWQPPRDFAFVLSSLAECDNTPLFALVPRIVHLRLLMIENSSQDTIALGAVAFRTQKKPEFRSTVEEERLTKTVPLESRPLLPAGKLLPGERLIIPLQIVFKFEEPNDSIFMAFAEPNDEMRMRYQAEVRAAPNALFAVAGNESDVRLSGRMLAGILAHEDPVPNLDDELIAGPSVKVESVVSDGVARTIRRFNPQEVVIRGPSGEGSCPFVLTRAEKNQALRSEGVILKSNRGKANEGTDTRRLAHFDGRVVLQELEPEVTTLDRAFIRAILPDGSTREIAARDSRLREVDGAVVTVSPHRPLAIDFETVPSIPGVRFELIVHGYFTPLPRSPASAAGAAVRP
jgi:hypothetical protein